MQAFRVACLFFPGETGEAIRAQIAEACLRWSPQIAVSGEAIFLEVGKCQGLYSEETLRARLLVLARRFETQFQVTFAADVPMSLALARIGVSASDGANLGQLPVRALLDYSDPFGFDPDLIRTVSQLIETLQKLGVKTLGKFLTLNPKTLPSRFGKLGLLLHQRIREARHLPWPRFTPPDRILERIDCEDGARELESLLFASKPAVDRAMSRLRGRAMRASKIRLTMHLEPYSYVKKKKREWEWALALPQGSATGLLPILRERLARDLEREYLEAPVTEIEFEILEMVPGHSAQKDFFHAKEEESEAWNSLLVRLTEKLGDGRVFYAVPADRYLPEKAWTKSLEAGDEQKKPALAFSERPLRLFKDPKPLDLESTRMLSIDGPEILSGEWWFIPGAVPDQAERQYFRVQVKDGADLWVFRMKGDETLYVHGVFD